LGKYRTILYISLLYCAGHACLAIFSDDRNGFYAGLTLIALGSGGIKPCVSALVGDQFTAENKQLVNKVFAIFYWSINLGSFFAFIPFFWMLFDQKASTWVVQARSMNLRIGSWTFEPAQMQLVNPALVMLLIPFTTGVVYPFFKRLGWELTPLRRMPIGIALG